MSCPCSSCPLGPQSSYRKSRRPHGDSQGSVWPDPWLAPNLISRDAAVVCTCPAGLACSPPLNTSCAPTSGPWAGQHSCLQLLKVCAQMSTCSMKSTWMTPCNLQQPLPEFPNPYLISFSFSISLSAFSCMI